MALQNLSNQLNNAIADLRDFTKGYEELCGLCEEILDAYTPEEHYDAIALRNAVIKLQEFVALHIE